MARRLGGGAEQDQEQSVKILILGAGAVGGYWGARLHQSGADVTFLLREKRAEKVRKEGLVVKSPKGDAVVPAKVVTKGSEGGPYDVVVLACKAYDLDSAIDSIAPAVGANTTIVPMLNGHAHFATLDKKFGAEKVAGGLARISGMLGPNGEILHSGASGVSFGERDGKPARAALNELDAACKKAGIEGGINPNINQDLWDKWIMLSTIAGMCSSMRGNIGDIAETEDGAAIVAETLEESRKVAAAEGHAPSDKVVAGIQSALTQKGSKSVASILGDMEKGGPAEGKQIVGDMLARARKHGIAAPNLRFAYAHLQAYEARRVRGGLAK
jgi:2-dehydropantoate 2-reductase